MCCTSQKLFLEICDHYIWEEEKFGYVRNNTDWEPKKKKRKENQHQTAPALLSGSLLYLGIISTSTSSDSKEPVGLVIYKILKILIL